MSLRRPRDFENGRPRGVSRGPGRRTPPLGERTDPRLRCQAASAARSRTPATTDVMIGAAASGSRVHASTAAPAAGLRQVSASSAAARPRRSPLSSALSAKPSLAACATRAAITAADPAMARAAHASEIVRSRAKRRPSHAPARVAPAIRATPARSAAVSTMTGLLGEVRDGLAGLGRSALRLLPLLLPAEDRGVEERLGAAELLGAASEGRIGVEHLVAVLQEAADSGLLGRAVEHPSETGRLQLSLVPVVEHHRSHGRVDADVEVVVEVAAEGGVPAEVPALALLVGRDLVVRRPRYRGEGRVPGTHVPQQPGGHL